MNTQIYKELKNKKSFYFKILFIFLFFISLYNPIIAQTDFRPGYYITWENDTLHGLIDYRADNINSNYCSFKLNEYTNAIHIEPNAIKAYRIIDSKYYISRNIEIDEIEKQVFLEFLVNGIFNLYFYAGIDYSFVYFIENQNGKLIELKNDEIDEYIDGKHYRRENLKYIGILKYVFADCNEIQNSITNVKLNHKSLINITKEYHKNVCNWEECIVYQKPVPSANLKIMPTFGINIVQLGFGKAPFSNFNFNSAAVPSVGLALNSAIPGLNEKLSLELGCNIYKFKPFAKYETNMDNSTFHYEAYLDFTSLQPSITLKYTRPWGKFKPVLAFGFTSNIFLSKNQNVIIKEIKNDNVFLTERTDYIPIVTDLHGLLFECGSNYLLSNGHIIFISVKLSNLGNYKYSLAVKNSGIRTNMMSANISLGIYINVKKK